MNIQLPIRRLIPRWRRVASTLLLAEGQPHSTFRMPSPVVAEEKELQLAIEEWKNQPTAGHLGHILAFSVSDEMLEQVKSIAQDAMKRGDSMTPAQTKLISSFFSSSDDVEQEQEHKEYTVYNPHMRWQMRETRALLAANPSNPLVLLDFAQLQLASGKFDKAERSLLGALSLSPDNRLVLRTIARFYVHAGQPDRAHAILARHRRTPSDPWLMAGEIAVSQAAGVGSLFAKKGSKAAREKKGLSIHMTELAGAVAGVELENGNWKHARDLFRVALVSPNDNVIAQAISDQKMLSLDLNAPEQRRVALTAVEAKTLLAWRGLNTVDAEVEALRWHAEEPFSSRPLHFLTALHAVQGAYEKVEALSRRGLIADPGDAALLSNLSFSLASLGRLEEAEKIAFKARSLDGGNLAPQTTATLGLVAMKRHNYELADELYESAIDQFQKKGRKDLIAICYAYYARAASSLSHPKCMEIVQRAVKSYQDSPTVDAALILRKLQLELEDPKQDEQNRRLAQWIYDSKTNSMIKKDGITVAGAPPIIFTP